ncbi:hypothetical protein Lal_00008024 [Lupinus albus]|nr:hypothetical protein Lal_00008024 [Lupinus albus]
MSDQREKRMKTIARRPHNFEAGDSSSAAGGRTAPRRDPNYSPSLQASRLTKFQGRKLAYVRYVDVSWLMGQGFQFPHQLEVIVLDEDLFLGVGGLISTGSPVGDCENEQWESFDAVEMYKSCLHGPHYFLADELTKVGILVNWPGEILKVMFRIATSSSRLLSYGIFISRIIDHVEIDTTDIGFHLINTCDHMLDLDLSDEENPATEPEQSATNVEASQAPQIPPFGLAHLDSMEQRLNQRIDVGFQTMNDIMDFGLMFLYDRVAADIEREA